MKKCFVSLDSSLKNIVINQVHYTIVQIHQEPGCLKVKTYRPSNIIIALGSEENKSWSNDYRKVEERDLTQNNVKKAFHI